MEFGCGDNRIELEFFSTPDGYNSPLIFDNIAGLTVWCSIDLGENWYDITDAANVDLYGSSLSVSYLKETILRDSGYSFQIEQASLPEYEPYSAPITVYCDDKMGVSLGTDIGGDRGGGRRHEKPSEGLFGNSDKDDSDEKSEESTEEIALLHRSAPGHQYRGHLRRHHRRNMDGTKEIG